MLLQGSDFSAQNPRNNRSGMVEINDKPKMMVASEEDGYRSDLNFIAGVIKAEDDLRMKRMIFRISRGRAIPSFFDLTTENKFTVIKLIKFT